MNQELPPLNEYVDLPALIDQVRPTFKTEYSLSWFVRHHRPALAESGAVILIKGQIYYHPERFKQAVVEIGQKAAIGRKRDKPIKKSN